MLVGTFTAGAIGGVLGPIAMLNFQGGVYVVSGLFVLAVLAPRYRAAVAGART
jgi:hypothetical protein